MEETIQFQSDVTLDLSAYKEFSKINFEAHGRNSALRCVTILCIIYLLLNITTSNIYLFGFLFLSLFHVAINLIQKHTNKDGGLTYKQILHTTNGAVPRKLVTCSHSGIRSENIGIEGQTHDTLESIKFVMESKNLLVIVNSVNLCHIIDKRTLTGGSRDEIVAFMQDNCPNMKKRIKTGKLGRFVTRFMWTLIILGCILSFASLLHIPEKISGQLTNDMSYQEIAAELESLGIVISDRTIQELEEFDRDYAEEYGDYYRINSDASKVCDLLYWEGSGTYDDQTWAWTPSTSGIYWFDMEVYNPDSIYTDFLTGINAMDPSISFSNITEDYSGVDLENGTGEIKLSFVFNGQKYTTTALYNYDWFDIDMLSEISRILSSDQNPKNLWFASDEGQGVILYYGTDDQVKILEAKTGLTFHN